MNRKYLRLVLKLHFFTNVLLSFEKSGTVVVQQKILKILAKVICISPKPRKKATSSVKALCKKYLAQIPFKSLWDALQQATLVSELFCTPHDCASFAQINNVFAWN